MPFTLFKHEIDSIGLGVKICFFEERESVEAHIYRTFIAATLWGKWSFMLFGNDSPGPLFKSHAHKFPCFYNRAKNVLQRALLYLPASSGRRWGGILGRKTACWSGQKSAGHWAFSGQFLQRWGHCCIARGTVWRAHCLETQLAL